MLESLLNPCSPIPSLEIKQRFPPIHIQLLCIQSSLKFSREMRIKKLDFPGGPVVKSLPATRNTGLTPGAGIFHMPRGN